MNVLKTFSSRCAKQSFIFKKCKRELSEGSFISSNVRYRPKAIYKVCTSQRKIHRNSHKKQHDDTDELLDDKNPTGMLQASGVVVRLPDSYFYMKVNDHSKHLDCKPPGTHLESGAIKNKPVGAKLGRLRAFLLVVSLIYAGGQLSSLAARMLHEFEIFSLPDDDDD